MTYHDGFDRTVSDWLDEQAGRGAPGYLDEVLARTTRTRQRPWWSSLERWLPMQSTTQFAPVPRLVGLLVVLGLIVVLGAVILTVGSRRPAPSPFGQATQGTILYAAADGDIYALDTASNQTHPLIVGPAADSGPLVSPDGTKVVFGRRDPGSAMMTTVVANADGSNAQTLNAIHDAPEALVWSPDSTRLAVAGVVQGRAGVWVVGLDGTIDPVAMEETGAEWATISDPQWRPDGRELVYMAGPMDTLLMLGLFRVQADGTDRQTIVEPRVPVPTRPTLSPDGSQIAYAIEEPGRGEIHVVDVDSGVDRRIAFDGSSMDAAPHWSPDGTRLVFERHTDGTYRLMIGSVDGGPVTEIGPARPDKTGGAEVQFLPDGSGILAFYNADRTTWLLDPAGGPGSRLDYDAASPPTWQRATD